MTRAHQVAWFCMILLLAACLDVSCSLLNPEKIGLKGTPLNEGENRQTLTVFAAASLKEPFDQIGKAFEAQNKEISVLFNYAGSQQLAQQIIAGARADIFASANQKQIDLVTATGIIAHDSQVIFAQNYLIIIYPLENPGGISRLEDLEKKGLRLVVAAKEAPVGQYTLEFLQKAAQSEKLPKQYKEHVLANVVSFEENVKAVLSKVALGEADAGIVYLSDISGDTKVRKLEIPEELNIKAIYLIAPLQGSIHKLIANRFIDFVLSEQGQEVIADHSFVPVK